MYNLNGKCVEIKEIYPMRNAGLENVWLSSVKLIGIPGPIKIHFYDNHLSDIDEVFDFPPQTVESYLMDKDEPFHFNPPLRVYLQVDKKNRIKPHVIPVGFKDNPIITRRFRKYLEVQGIPESTALEALQCQSLDDYEESIITAKFELNKYLSQPKNVIPMKQMKLIDALPDDDAFLTKAE